MRLLNIKQQQWPNSQVEVFPFFSILVKIKINWNFDILTIILIKVHPSLFQSQQSLEHQKLFSSLPSSSGSSSSSSFTSHFLTPQQQQQQHFIEQQQQYNVGGGGQPLYQVNFCWILKILIYFCYIFLLICKFSQGDGKRIIGSYQFWEKLCHKWIVRSFCRTPFFTFFEMHFKLPLHS